MIPVQGFEKRSIDNFPVSYQLTQLLQEEHNVWCMPAMVLSDINLQ